MNGHRIGFEHRLVYLGVIVDMHLSWMPHLTAVQERAYNFVHKMDRLTASNGGIKQITKDSLPSVGRADNLIRGLYLVHRKNSRNDKVT